MKRSFPLAQLAVGSGQFSAWNRLGSVVFPARHSSLVCLRAISPSLGSRHARPRRAGAFTLIELLVVTAIVAILAGLALGALGFVNRKGAASRAQTEVAALATAVESYKLDFGSYPPPENLYTELTAAGPVNTNKVYFEPPAGMVNTNSTPRFFQDPYGNRYNYATNPVRNIGFFDLWCVPPDAENEAGWIHN